jgi:glycosyltransferase involved in cell wall biosynthesis
MTKIEHSGIAVIIPFYNGSAFLARSVASVKAQTLQPDEIVIVNDGSSAAETEWVHAFCEAQGLRVLDKPNGGQGSARNAGVAATSAPYICFLDQDDFFLSHHHATLRAGVPEDDPRFGWVYADLIQANGAGQVYKTATVKDKAQHPKTSLMKMLLEDMHVLPSASLVDRRAFEAVAGFDPQFRGYEDDDLYTRLFRAGFTNIFIDHPVTVWCVNEDSTSFSVHMARSRMLYMLKLAEALPDVRALNYMFMRDCLIPRFAKQILRDARRVQQPEHKFHQHRDEIYQMTQRCVDVMLANPFVKGRRRRKIRARWFLVRAYRYGFLQAILGKT